MKNRLLLFHWFCMACFLLLPLSAAEKPAGSQAERVLWNFDIAFLTEVIPDFPMKGIGRGYGLELRAPDEDVMDPGVFSFGRENDDHDVASWAPVTVKQGQLAGHVFDGGEENDRTPWTRIDPDKLVDMIKGNIHEDSWANTRNYIAADEDTLVVRQRPEVLKRIRAFLDGLRAQRARILSVEVATVPVGTLEEKLLGGSPWLSSEQFEALLAKAEKKGKKLSLTACNGQTVSAHSGERRSILTDFDVNQTGVSPVINPLLEVMALGLLIQVRPMAITGTGWTTLELQVIQRGLSGDPLKHEGPYGEYALARVKEMQLRTKLVLEDGRGIMAGYLEGTHEGEHDHGVICRIQPLELAGELAKAEDPPSEEFFIRRYNLEPVFQTAGQSIHPLSRLPGNPEDVTTLVTCNVAPEAWHDARADIEADDRELVVCQRKAVHDKVSALVGEWTRRAASLVTVERWTLSGDAPSVNQFLLRAGPGGALPDDWQAIAESLALPIKTRACITGLMGKHLYLESVVVQRFVADYECVSGGTTWTLTATPDPIVEAAGSGFDQQTRVLPLPGGQASLHLRAVHGETVFEDTVDFMAPWELTSRISTLLPPPEEGEGHDDNGDSDDGGGPIPGASGGRAMVFVPTTIDLPEQHLWKINRPVQVKWRVPTILEAHTENTEGRVANVMIVRVSPWQGWER